MRTQQPTPVLLPGESHGQKNLAGYSPQGLKESDTTEATQHTCASKFYQWNCTISTIHFCNIFLILSLFFLFYFIFRLYIIVVVLPNIKMNPPQVDILNSTTELCNDTLCLYLYTHICVHENIIFPNNMEHHNAYNQEKQKIYFTVSSNRNSTQY